MAAAWFFLYRTASRAMTAPPAAGSTMAQTAVFGFSPTLFPVPDDDPPQCRPGAGSSEKPPAHGKTDKVSPVLKSGGRRRPFSLPAADFLLFFLCQGIFQILAERKSFAYFNKTSIVFIIHRDDSYNRSRGLHFLIFFPAQGFPGKKIHICIDPVCF